MEKIFGLSICELNYTELIAFIENAINQNLRKKITYINFNGVNLILRNKSLLHIFEKFEIIHPDGIGTKIATRILFGRNGLKTNFTGSDFYPILMKNAELKGWKIYLFGEKSELLRSFENKYPGINLVGTFPGYGFNTEDVINDINKTSPDILLVGLGCPKQEQWIFDNNNRINPKILLAVGAGIKVLCNSKVRGPKMIQNLGLEWLYRVILEPGRLWKRYILGIPFFLVSVLILKIKKTLNFR